MKTETGASHALSSLAHADTPVHTKAIQGPYFYITFLPQIYLHGPLHTL